MFVKNIVDASTEQRNIEKSQLHINSMFFVGVGVTSVFLHNSFLITILCAWALGSSWYMVVHNKMDFYRRAFATVLFVHIIFAVLYLYNPYMPLFFVLYIAMVVTAGIYGFRKIIIIPVVSNTYFWVIGLMMGHGYQGSVLEHLIKHVLPIIVIYFVDYVLYIWLLNREKSHENLLHTLKMLEKTESSKSNFLMNLSGEIRKPIYHTCDMCDSMQEEKDADLIHNYLKYIGASGLWLAGNIEDLIDFSVLQTKKIVLENQEYTAEEMVNILTNVCMAIRDSKDIEMILDVDATLPTSIFGDKYRVCRIIGSLVNNAVKHTDKGGIRICMTQRKDVAGVSLIISVTDTGRGVEPELLKKIQEIFRSNDFTISPSETGIGLELLMTYYLVSIMGGNISIQSEIGKGTIINVILPQKVMDSNPFVPEYHKKTICFIEDDAIASTQIATAYRHMFAHMGEQLNAQIYYCSSMVSFQERLRKEDYENILLTVNEYEGYRSYFDELSLWHHLVVVTEFDNDKYLHKDNLCTVTSPFQVASMISAFQKQEMKKNQSENGGQEMAVSPIKEPEVVESYDFYIGALNTKMGVTYCGNKEAYLSILEEYALKGDKNWKPIQEMFETGKWDRYVVEVHGIKSAMLTIGAKEISKRAKRLEEACKEGDISYVLENHDAMVDLYKKMLVDLQQYFHVEPEKSANETVDASSLLPMTDEEINQMISEIEEMAFTLDGNGMMKVVEDLCNRSYRGKTLQNFLIEYRRKVEREDYLSALDLAQKEFGDSE